MNVLTKNYEKFIKNITPDYRDKVRKNACEVCRCLTSQFENSDCEIIGSYAKNTEINTEIDIVFKNPQTDFNKIKEVLLEKYSLSDDLTVDFKNSKLYIIPGRDSELYINGKWVQNTTEEEIINIEKSESERHNTHDLIKIIKHWRNIHNIDMDSYFIEREAVKFITDTYHDSDGYLLYGFLIMKFFENLCQHDEASWIEDVKIAYELCQKAIYIENKDVSIKCFRQVFGEEFPEKPL